MHSGIAAGQRSSTKGAARRLPCADSCSALSLFAASGPRTWGRVRRRTAVMLRQGDGESPRRLTASKAYVTVCQRLPMLALLGCPMEASLSLLVLWEQGPVGTKNETHPEPSKSPARQAGRSVLAPRHSNRHNNPIVALFFSLLVAVMILRCVPVVYQYQLTNQYSQDGAVLLERSSVAHSPSINFRIPKIGCCSSVHKSLVSRPDCRCPI